MVVTMWLFNRVSNSLSQPGGVWSVLGELQGQQADQLAIGIEAALPLLPAPAPLFIDGLTC